MGYVGLNGVGMGCGDLTIPELAFMAFQLAFAVITLAILTSAMAERVKISGAVAGLVAITPAAGFVGPMSALVIGAVAGVICYKAMLFRINRSDNSS